MKSTTFILITHSTAIEGFTLTEIETASFWWRIDCQRKTIGLSFDEWRFKKPMSLPTRQWAKYWNTPVFCKSWMRLLCIPMEIYTKCYERFFRLIQREFRLCSVSAGVGGRSYMNYQKCGKSRGTLFYIARTARRRIHFGNNMS